MERESGMSTQSYDAVPRDGPEVQPNPTPRVYVASLSDYNAGRLHGVWLDANLDLDEMEAAVQSMLDNSPEPSAEEYAIHDYENFDCLHLDEYTPLPEIAELGAGIAEHGPAFARWAEFLGPSELSRLGDFEDCYRGHWASMEEYAEELLDDMGVKPDEFGPEWLQPYLQFDLEAFARDIALDGGVLSGADGVYLFDVDG